MIFDKFTDEYYSAYYFFRDMFDALISFLYTNKVVLSFVLIPIVTSLILICIDLIFDVSDYLTVFNRYKDTVIKGNFRYYRNKNSKKLNMDEVYQRSKENADYKHNLKMQESREFRANAEYAHSLKMSELNKFRENSEYIKKPKYSNPKHSNKKLNLDIDVED